jgi:tryptophan-rich sensory protein
MKKKVDILVLAACLIIVSLVSFIGSVFTSPAVKSAWYQSIKPSITPPNLVFPIVWSILFFLIALSLYFAWIKSSKKQKKTIMILFGINFILNILWSVIYFGMQNPSLALAEIVLLWASIFSMILSLRKIRKLSSNLLIPYLLWVSFAAFLNYLSIK